MMIRYILPPSMTMIVDNYDILLPTTTLKAVVKVYNNDNGDYEDIIFKEVITIPVIIIIIIIQYHIASSSLSSSGYGYTNSREHKYR